MAYQIRQSLSAAGSDEGVRAVGALLADALCGRTVGSSGKGEQVHRFQRRAKAGAEAGPEPSQNEPKALFAVKLDGQGANLQNCRLGPENEIRVLRATIQRKARKIADGCTELSSSTASWVLFSILGTSAVSPHQWPNDGDGRRHHCSATEV
jgi:hypothetical protein